MTESPHTEVEPTRWLDEPSGAADFGGPAMLRDLAQFGAAKASGLDHAAGLVALRGAIASQTAAVPAAAAATKAIGIKTVVGGLALGALVGWWALQRPSPSTPAKPEVVAVAPATAEHAASGSDATAPAATPAVGPRAPAVVPPPAEPEAIGDDPVIVDDDEADTPRPRTAVRKPKPDVREGEDASADRYLEEAQLVARARKALSGDPATALQLTKQHAKEFPKGALVEERRALSIRALAALGRMDEAQRDAESFLASFGDGPHAAAVRRAVSTP
ncbi:MAG: hypothetical protein K1X88_01960 [Nannocystaceae bacterium]|nr:hypothetical protein [Nannocystaceae bacterium]